MRSSLPAALAVCSSLLLAACGGGGGGSAPGDGGGGQQNVEPSAVISSSNQMQVARVTFDDTQAIVQTPLPLSEPGRARALAITRGADSGPIALVNAAVQRAVLEALAPRHRVSVASTDGRVRPAATETFSEACSLGGSVTVVASDADNNDDVSAGDSVQASFNQCSESAGVVMNGAMSVSLQSVAVNTDTQFRFTGTIAFDRLSLIAGSQSAVINGAVTVDAAQTLGSTVTLQIGVTIGANGLTTSLTSPSRSDSVAYDAGSRWVVDSNGSTFSLQLNGTFTVTSIGGRVSVATVQPVVFRVGDDHASSGQMVVTGASGSRLRITALDNTQARLELDANGDGTYEAVRDIAWDDTRLN